MCVRYTRMIICVTVELKKVQDFHFTKGNVDRMDAPFALLNSDGNASNDEYCACCQLRLSEQA